jgi:hypothetical protein
MNLEGEIKTCYSLTDFCKRLNLSTGGGGFKKAKKIIEDNKLDISHFNNGSWKKRKYEVVEKICPVCNKKFETQLGERKEKTTCSHSCSNTYFRTGKNNGNWSDDSYRSTCFLYHKKECLICGEDKIVEVHHMDENNKNNNPENLVPLCPTHHQYWHSRYKKEIEDKIYNYIKEFKNMTTFTQYQQQQQINQTD